MVTEPLDFAGLLAELENEPPGNADR